MKVKEGQRVRVIKRDVTTEDRRSNRYFDHMSGMVGTVENIYGPDDVAVRVEPESMTKVASAVQKEAVKRMREKFLSSVSEEQKGRLSAEEINFDANYMLLVRAEDLEPA